MAQSSQGRVCHFMSHDPGPPVKVGPTKSCQGLPASPTRQWDEVMQSEAASIDDFPAEFRRIRPNARSCGLSHPQGHATIHSPPDRTRGCSVWLDQQRLTGSSPESMRGRTVFADFCNRIYPRARTREPLASTSDRVCPEPIEPVKARRFTTTRDAYARGFTPEFGTNDADRPDRVWRAAGQQDRDHLAEARWRNQRDRSH